VAKLSPRQLAWRGRIETGIRIAQPFLDLVLAAGERISRMAEREELETGGGARTSLAPGQEEAARGH
jgi:hypothetical protein